MASWLDKCEGVATLGHDIMEMINERNNLKRTGSNISRLQGTIRVKLQTYSTDLQSLKDMLLKASSSYSLTQQELQSRQNQLDNLISKERQLKQAFNSSGATVGRSALFDDSFENTGRESWEGNSRDQDVEDMDFGKFKQKQKDIIQEQDKGLDALSQAIQRQKLMGQAIGDELNYHNDLIDEITDDVERVNTKVDRTEKHVKKITKKTGSCIMIIIIILLLIAILVVAIY